MSAPCRAKVSWTRRYACSRRSGRSAMLTVSTPGGATAAGSAPILRICSTHGRPLRDRTGARMPRSLRPQRRPRPWHDPEPRNAAPGPAAGLCQRRGAWPRAGPEGRQIRPRRSELSATPDPTSWPSCSASSSRPGSSHPRISPTVAARSPGATATRTCRHRSRSASDSAAVRQNMMGKASAAGRGPATS